MIVVVMGVSGCGKSTIGARLAETLGAAFLEGDRFHPPENVAKMSRGEPLDDRDRLPWLTSLGEALAAFQADGKSAVLACSALKRRYRDILRTRAPEAQFIYLRGDKSLIARRMGERRHEYMPASLLDSQFATLEEPAPEEQALWADIDREPEAIVREILPALTTAAVTERPWS